MKQTLYTETLARAAEAEGGTAALASMLHVPEKTLERWMNGRAQTPLRAFLKVLERLTMHEASGAAQAPTMKEGEPLSFCMGQLLARCSRCDSTEFAPAEPEKPLTLVSALACRACGEKVTHGDLISQLAQDAVQYAHAMTAARTRRQASTASARNKSDVRR
jgi:DNA-binding transcriptional regulator YdaS (Cro superfamily)